MNTEIILYKQEVANNPKFALQVDYGWTFTGTNGVDWEKMAGKIRKIPTGVSRTIYQAGMLQVGAQYRIRFNISGMSAGSVLFRNSVGGTPVINVLADAIYDTTFEATGTDIIFDVNSTFDGAISNVSVTEHPNAYSLDLSEDTDVPLNFNIDDLIKLGTRKTNYSNTFVIKGTGKNNIALDKIYKVNSESLFDPNKPSRVVILNSGLTVFSGVMFVDEIIKIIQDGIEDISYEVTVFGELTNIFDKFGDKTIKDLDFSRWDHTLTIDHILWSSNAPAQNIGLGIGADSMYVYDNSTSSYLQTSTDSNTKTVTSIASYTHNGFARVRLNFGTAHSFVEGDLLHVIAQDNNLLAGTQTVATVISSTSIALHMAYASLTSTSVNIMSVSKRSWSALGYFYPMQDNGVWRKQLVNGDTAPGALTNGRLYTIAFLNGDDFSNLAKDPLNHLNPITPAVGVTFYSSNGGIVENPVAANSWTNGSILYRNEDPSAGAQMVNKHMDINHWHPNDYVPHIFVREVWNKMFSVIDYFYDCPLIDTQLFRRLIMPMDQKFNVTDQQMVYMNSWLPSMKLSEFFMSICNLFNLVVLESKEQSNLISLVSRNDFFNGNVVNLEVEAGQPIQIKLSNSIIPSSFRMKYKDCADYYNSLYNKQYGDTANSNAVPNIADRKYGDYYIQTNNKVAKREEAIELKYESTVLSGNVPGAYDVFNPGSGNDKVISACFKADENGNNVQRHSANRILIASVRGTNYSWSISYVVSSLAEIMDVTSSTGAKVYASAGHIDNVYDPAPSVDINFDTLLGQYFPITYPAVDWQNGTQYGRCYSKYLRDQLDKNSKLVSGTIRFSTTRIANLSFQDTYQFNNYHLKLRKITGWNANGEGFCKSEFTTKNI